MNNDNDIIISVETANIIRMLVDILYIEKGLVQDSSKKDSIDKSLSTLSLDDQKTAKRKFRKILKKAHKNKRSLSFLSKGKRRSIVFMKLYSIISLKYRYLFEEQQDN